MVRWGRGDVVTIEGRVAWRRTIGRSCRMTSRAGDGIPGWRGSGIRRALRDIAQVEAVRVEPSVEVLFGHIVFPTTTPPRPVVWSTNGIPPNRLPTRVPAAQSARTQERLVGRAAMAQCWSECGLRGLLEHARHLPEERIRVVPPLVYVDLPQAETRHDGDVRAIFIGASGRVKGLDVLLEAMRHAGQGLRLQVVTSDHKPEGLPTSVEWVGPLDREAVLARLVSSDIHVFPSRVESLGGVVVEALAAGLPQVVDEHGVPSEIVGDSGFAVPAGDAGALAEAMMRLAGDDHLRGTMAAAARRRYDTRYSPTVVGPQLEALIDDAAT